MARAASRLSPESALTLRELASVLGPREHAVVWALNYQLRCARLPTCHQIVMGLRLDLQVKVSYASAARALKDIRKDEARRAAG